MKEWNEFYPAFTANDYYKRIKPWTRFLDRIMEFTAKGNPILEIGFGTGQMSIYLCSRNYPCYGIEKNDIQVERAKKLAMELKVWPHFMYGDVFKIAKDKEQYVRFWKGQYHTVFSQGLLEHFSDEKIKELFEIQLEIGKVCAFSVPLDKFGHQSRGDERLLPEEHWKKLVESYKILHWSTFTKGNGQLMAIIKE